ncbi:inactive pancreatic lipase-related protein 1-like isoform X2 [Daphnia pulex]|uniref:inactive pancreatic lipase-related protein 1-like isoform X2 n=1 Tax=Daphnia pulex TaxID=6669 RepID=UPI001EDF23F1|nr:inactive pancreatic lipase-related protein 1-like isoform X2 [Daphnia pulex]
MVVKFSRKLSEIVSENLKFHNCIILEIMNLLPLKIMFSMIIVFLCIAALNFGTTKGAAQIQQHFNSDPGPDSVLFQLFTRKNPGKPQILQLEDITLLEQSNYNSSLPTKIFVHGYGANPSQGYSSKDEYLLREDCNFISVDWTTLGSSNYVLVALNNVPIVGNTTGAFVEFLFRQGTPLSAFHLIGFSMGAHIVGNAGAFIASIGLLPRITGLDPSEYAFPLELIDNCLDITDASFVDVIHTSEISYKNAVGHVDFYPNGGFLQSGCPPRIPDTECCNHCRAVDLFAESINSPLGFKAVLCNSSDNFQNGFCNSNTQALMGEPVSTNVRGLFYLATNGQPPYAQELLTLDKL